jgi:hypothetical protein
MLLLLAGLLLVPETTSKPPPLPFDTNGYFATHAIEFFPSHLPLHASLKDRLWFGYFKLWQMIHPYEPDPTNTTFAAIPFGPQPIEVSLNGCTQADGPRYFMPTDIAVGFIRFGGSNALNGRQWIAACETALQTGMPEILDPHTRSMRPEKLVLIRYPKQKTVLVLTATEAAEFRRTNSTGFIDKEHR